MKSLVCFSWWMSVTVLLVSAAGASADLLENGADPGVQN